MEKFHEVISTSPKVIGTHMLNFKLNFKCSPLKFFLGGGPLSQFGVCTSIPWSIPSTCKNLRGQRPVPIVRLEIQFRGLSGV